MLMERQSGLACGSNSQYLEIIYSENGEFDNIDRFYFDEQDALNYVATLTDSIPQTDCSGGDDSEVNPLVGSWNSHAEGPGAYDETILSFTDTGEFFFFNIDSGSSDACRERGYEYGTYELVGNDIILTRALDTSACIGLFNTIDEVSTALSITSQETQQLTIIDVAEDPLSSFTITRILTNSDSIVGSWHEAANQGGDLNQGNKLSNLVLFLGDGRFYSMDVDLSESAAQDNGFGFGDYTFDLGGAGLSLTRRFDSVGEFTLDEAQDFPNADIVNNELFINSVDDQFGIGRVSSDADNPSAPLAFTTAELENGFTWFFPLLDLEDCGNEWRIEEMTFNTNGYSLDFCGLGLGDEVDEAFVVLDSGVVELVETEEFVNRVGFDAELQAYLVCWADTEQEALSCSAEVQGLGFLSRADAQAYIGEQNNVVSEATIEISGSWTVTAYQQGIEMCPGGGSECDRPSQCDLNENKQVGDVEVFSERWVRAGNMITVINPETLEEEYTVPIDLSSNTIDLSYQGVEEEPTGESGDVFFGTFDEVGSITWNDSAGQFEGDFESENSLSWTLSDQVSTCLTTETIEITVTSGDIDAFLNL